MLPYPVVRVVRAWLEQVADATVHEYLDAVPHFSITVAVIEEEPYVYPYLTYCFQSIESIVAPVGSALALVKVYLCHGM